MLVEVLVSAVVSLVLLVAIVGYVIRRSPELFVAERLAEKLHRGDDAGIDSAVTTDSE